MNVALAALDPNVSLDDPAQEPWRDDELEVRPEPVPGADPIRIPAITMAVTVDPPLPYQRWRFFLFYCLIRLAAWVWPMKLELYRTPQPWEEET